MHQQIKRKAIRGYSK